jgi:hypothetical protein
MIYLLAACGAIVALVLGVLVILGLPRDEG